MQILIDSRKQVVTPEISRLHEHVAPFAHNFPPLDKNAEVLLLIGVNNELALSTHVPVPDVYPLIHDTVLGYALVGRVNTDVAPPGHDTCVSVPHLKSDELPTTTDHTDDEQLMSVAMMSLRQSINEPLINVFVRHMNDETVGTSMDDKLFLCMMNERVEVLPNGSIQLPLPVRENVLIPDNRDDVRKRSFSTIKSIKKNAKKTQGCLTAMGKNIDLKFVEQVPSDELVLRKGKSCYIPVFPVIQSKPFKED